RQLLLPLEQAGVSMTRIESRPGRTRLWDYVFFIDVDGHAQDEVLTKVLATMANEAPLLRVLGSYPSAL
ncbi:MAG: prephenate dehydratase, partial [Pseudomonadales bacterium]